MQIILTPLILTLLVLFLIYFTFQNKLERHAIQTLLKEHQKENQEQRLRFDEYQIKSLKLIQDSLQQALAEVRNQVRTSLHQHTEELTQKINGLIEQTKEKLLQINHTVDQQLSTGLDKTTATFTDIVKRLTIIDQAQKKMTELSSHVTHLQDILNDKRSRGTFGEVQMSNLIKNTIPKPHFSMQHTLSNGKRVDCLLFLPEPTGNMAIDAKFPLESYQKLTHPKISEKEKHHYKQQFRIDIKKHIKDISQKYILPGETTDSAIMFIPAEAIFCEIHNHHPDLVEYSHQSRVWLVSPTTLMATLTTARAVLKDEATRKQIHIIQAHLIALSKDFSRFQLRMNNLTRHIHQAHADIDKVHQSSRKLTDRFDKIEKVELGRPLDTTKKLDLNLTEINSKETD